MTDTDVLDAPAPADETTTDLQFPDLIQRAELRAVDRCDNSDCNAQAYIAVQINEPVDGIDQSGELLFCGHHYTKHEDKLKDKVTRDDREKLLAKLVAAY